MIAQHAQKLMGPGAASLKYDVIASLAVAGMSGPPVLQTSMLRLVGLITARYNWKADEVCVGQREMARMWSVNERTVKREIKRLTDMQILICKRPGVRGRVGAYRLNMARIVEMSEPAWALIGPDFDARMRERHLTTEVKVVAMSDYAPRADTPALASTPWGRVCARLKANDPAVYAAWFAPLSFVGCDAGTLTVTAPSRFAERYIETHLSRALCSAAEAEFGPLRVLAFA
ncbi:DnaA N-terminal domain-containing protein [uncultured Tateyamaria sp.]|uniref:DnaA N-terminal domain-containing protein n=1 Tax=Tateyamaria sp. 1078 TaxID=3417464 RepID=UPI00263553B6|nr:DnaA N-terminal domain-containing protein [uncultured Tateyamaria sp.]